MRVAPLLVAAVLAGAAGCSRDASSSLPRPSKPFCDAAHRYDVRVEKRASLDEQIRIVRTIADHAPKDVARDADTFLDALERRRDGDKSVVDNAKIEKAVNNVNRRAAIGCGFYKQDSGGI